MRNSVVVLHNPVTQEIHFCSTALQGEDQWFPFAGDNVDFFIEIEQLMVSHGIAHNVTSVQYLRKSGNTVEHTVVYNEVETALA